MRKFLAAVLTVSMVMSFAACGKKDDTVGEDVTLTPTIAAEQEPAAAVITPDVAENTVGSILWEAFCSAKKENPEISVIDMANTLYTNPVIEFAAGAYEVEEGWLSGFSEEISGFESAATFGPMMGSIAFVGYVFDLADAADADAFIKNLQDKSNPRWNICVEADYVQAGAYENTVYFLMYPAFMDEDLGGEPVEKQPLEVTIINPDVAENTWGETLWNSFVEIMDEDPYASAIDVAFALSLDGSIAFEAGAAEVLPGTLTGFNADITEFKNGGMFAPMMSSMAFIGYVFELEEGADVDSFLSVLKSNCNPRWNVCVEAEQMVVGAYNTMVFFLMCPNSGQSE